MLLEKSQLTSRVSVSNLGQKPQLGFRVEIRNDQDHIPNKIHLARDSRPDFVNRFTNKKRTVLEIVSIDTIISASVMKRFGVNFCFESAD